jgi:hypothetical protein
LVVVAAAQRVTLVTVVVAAKTRVAVIRAQAAVVAAVPVVEIPLAVLAAAAWAYLVKAATAQAAQLFAGLPVIRAAAVHLVQVGQVRLVVFTVAVAVDRAQVPVPALAA